MTDITKLILGVLETALSVLTIFVIPYIASFAKAKLGEYKYNLILSYTKTAVKAAEQIYVGSGRGAEKKAAVLEFLENRGFTVDPDVIDAFIESAVLDLKRSTEG